MKSSDPVAETRQSLWLLVISPIIWSVHFLLCYITAAVWCAKYAGPDKSLGPVRTAICTYTILAVIGIAFVAFRGYRKHSHGTAALPHDDDTPEDRHRFLGFATLLLSGLSLIGTLFEALVLAFFWKCH